MRNLPMVRLIAPFLVLFLWTAFSAHGEGPLSVPIYPDSPFLHARSAILLDATTGEALFEKSADLVIPPASLTKLMTIHLAYKATDAGIVSLDGLVPIMAQDCAPELPYRSSLMFLQAGMRVSLRELLAGMAVPSGNDAAFAVARHISGSIENFAIDMNREAAALGLRERASSSHRAFPKRTPRRPVNSQPSAGSTSAPILRPCGNSIPFRCCAFPCCRTCPVSTQAANKP